MSTRSTAVADVVIVGAGIIGLACAWRLTQHGARVTLVDPYPASGATHVAAGMLAPVSEIEHGEPAQLALGAESLRRYPEFVAELESATGQIVGLRREGTMIIATDAGDRDLLVELHAFQTSLGLSAELLTSRECRRLEAILSPDVRCGLLVTSDHSVDNRRLATALLTAVQDAGATIVSERVTAICVEAGAVTGVEAGGLTLTAPTVVVAAGPWSGRIAGLPDGVIPPVRPIKGQIVRLRASGHVPLPRHTVRGFVNGQDIYLVPRADGELVIGASVEEAGFDTTVRAGAVRELLRDARAIMPGIDELELVETNAGLRPGSPDNRPVIGATSLAGLVVATGHHRNGILLAPITADLVSALVLRVESAADHALLALTRPDRFHAADRAHVGATA